MIIIKIVTIAADADFVFISSGMVFNIPFKRFLPGGIIIIILSVIVQAYQICTNP